MAITTTPTGHNPGLQRGFATPYRAWEEALNSGKAIWVLNNTIPKGRLLITITDPLTGKAKELAFERTFIPFCVTDMVPREILERSLALRDYIQKKVLLMISEEEAINIITSPKGRKEYDRLNTSEFADNGNVSARVREMMSNTQDAEQLMAVSPSTPTVQPSTLHPKLKIWEDLLSVEVLKEDDLLSEITIHEAELTEDDCRYLTLGKYPEAAKNWAKDKLVSGTALKKSVVETEAARAKKTAGSLDSGFDGGFDIEIGV